MEETQTQKLPELPKELMTIIQNLIFYKTHITKSDTNRLRAVCKSWRNLLSPPKPSYNFPLKLPHPITPHHVTSLDPPRRGFFNLSESTFYLISPPSISACTPTVCENASMSWLARFEPNGSGKVRIVDPFSGLAPGNPYPGIVLDSLHVGVIEVGKCFSLKFVNTSRRRKDVDRTLVVDKAVMISNAVMVLYNQGDLGFFKLEGNRWKVSYDFRRDDHDENTCYDDLILYKGMFCVINRSGRTLLLDSSALNGVEIAKPSSGIYGNQKHLVEACGALYMIERNLDAYTTKLSLVEEVGRLVASELPTTMAVKFKIYKLNQEEKQWVEVNDLGNVVLFVGYDCSFGFSTRFVPGVKGNCLYFADECYTYNSCFDDGEAIEVLREMGCPEAGVFDLVDGSVKPLSSDSQIVGLFWPPPAWLQLDSASSSN